MKIFSISTGLSWNNYKSKGPDYSLNLDNMHWYIFCNTQIKNFSLDVGYRKPSKDLYGQLISLNENYSVIQASYRKNNFSMLVGCMYPFTNGTRYGSKVMSSVVPSNKDIFIKDNANMFYVGFSYNISWGKSLFGIKKSLNNSDWDNGILRINDN